MFFIFWAASQLTISNSQIDFQPDHPSLEIHFRALEQNDNAELIALRDLNPKRVDLILINNELYPRFPSNETLIAQIQKIFTEYEVYAKPASPRRSPISPIKMRRGLGNRKPSWHDIDALNAQENNQEFLLLRKYFDLEKPKSQI